MPKPRSIWRDYVLPGVIIPNFVPVYPANSYVPGSTCNHNVKPIRIGSVMYCEVCRQTGFDHIALPGLSLDRVRDNEYFAQNWLDLPEADRDSMWVERIKAGDHEFHGMVKSLHPKLFEAQPIKAPIKIQPVRIIETRAERRAREFAPGA